MSKLSNPNIIWARKGNQFMLSSHNIIYYGNVIGSWLFQRSIIFTDWLAPNIRTNTKGNTLFFPLPSQLSFRQRFSFKDPSYPFPPKWDFLSSFFSLVSLPVPSIWLLLFLAMSGFQEISNSEAAKLNVFRQLRVWVNILQCGQLFASNHCEMTHTMWMSALLLVVKAVPRNGGTTPQEKNSVEKGHIAITCLPLSTNSVVNQRFSFPAATPLMIVKFNTPMSHSVGDETSWLRTQSKPNQGLFVLLHNKSLKIRHFPMMSLRLICKAREETQVFLQVRWERNSGYLAIPHDLISTTGDCCQTIYRCSHCGAERESALGFHVPHIRHSQNLYTSNPSFSLGVDVPHARLFPLPMKIYERCMFCKSLQ